jgi:hypothetical protein
VRRPGLPWWRCGASMRRAQCVIGPVALARKQTAAHLACDFLFFGVGALPPAIYVCNRTTAPGWCRAVFDAALCALDASPDAALCALDASLDAALCALHASPDVVAACRFAERQSLGSGSAPGPQLGIPLAPWAELTKPTWRVPEWKKSFDEKEFAFRSCREVLFRFSCRNRCPQAA